VRKRAPPTRRADASSVRCRGDRLRELAHLGARTSGLRRSSRSASPVSSSAVHWTRRRRSFRASATCGMPKSRIAGEGGRGRRPGASHALFGPVGGVDASTLSVLVLCFNHGGRLGTGRCCARSDRRDGRQCRQTGAEPARAGRELLRLRGVRQLDPGSAAPSIAGRPEVRPVPIRGGPARPAPEPL
jgi:hypothetical protein